MTLSRFLSAFELSRGALLVSASWHALLWLLASPAQAEIVFDGSVGPTGSLSGQMNIDAGFGTQTGANLLHSFSTFHVRDTESATFSGPDSIDRIIGRVTGNELSLVQGLITSSIPDVALYLLNPQGFALSGDASIEIPGSVYLSSAQELVFSDGVSLLTGSAELPTSLSMAMPMSFGFVGNPAALNVDGLIRSGRISLVGGDINLNNATLLAPGGRVDLIALSDGSADLSGAQPQLDQVGPGAPIMLSLESFDDLRRVDGVLRANVETTGPANGPIYVRGSRLQMDGGFVFADRNGEGVAGNLDIEVAEDVMLSRGARLTTDVTGVTGGEAAGSISIRAGGNLSLTGRGTGIASTTRAGSSGAGGLIDIQAADVVLREASVVSSATAGEGPAGDISINANNLNLFSGARINTTTQSDGAGGTISVTVQRLETSGVAPGDNGGAAGIDVSTIGGGSAGSILVSADSVFIGEGSTLEARSNIDPDGLTRGGVLRIDADTVEISGGELSATTFDALGGSVVVNASQRISITDAGRVRAETTGAGRGGEISLNAPEIELRDAAVSATSQSTGDGGGITVSAGGLSLVDSSITSASLLDELTAGAAGTIAVATDSLQIARSSISTDIAAGTVDLAPANVTIDVTGSARVTDGSTLSSNTLGAARGGALALTASELLVSAAELSTQAGGTGPSGNIVVAATDGVRLDSSAALNTNSVRSQGGSVVVTTGGVSRLRDARISASAGASGAGGNLEVTFDRLVLERSQLLARADAGNGGRIDLTADAVVQDFAGLISADSNTGTAGVVNIVVPESDVSSVVVVQNENLQSVPQLVRSFCGSADRDNSGGSSLVELPAPVLLMPEQMSSSSVAVALGCDKLAF